MKKLIKRHEFGLKLTAFLFLAAIVGYAAHTWNQSNPVCVAWEYRK